MYPFVLYFSVFELNNNKRWQQRIVRTEAPLLIQEKRGTSTYVRSFLLGVVEGDREGIQRWIEKLIAKLAVKCEVIDAHHSNTPPALDSTLNISININFTASYLNSKILKLYQFLLIFEL